MFDSSHQPTGYTRPNASGGQTLFNSSHQPTRYTQPNASGGGFNATPNNSGGYNYRK